MAVRRFPQKRKVVPLATQIAAMAKSFEQFRVQWTKNSVCWEGELKPSPISETYTVRILYSLKRPPRVWVVNPPLDEMFLADESAHIYKDNNNALCLYYPDFNEWTPIMLIADTIVPWILKWLFFYEGWLALDGEWKGGGIPHKKRRPPLFKSKEVQRKSV